MADWLPLLLLDPGAVACAGRRMSQIVTNACGPVQRFVTFLTRARMLQRNHGALPGARRALGAGQHQRARSTHASIPSASSSAPRLGRLTEIQAGQVLSRPRFENRPLRKWNAMPSMTAAKTLRPTPPERACM